MLTTRGWMLIVIAGASALLVALPGREAYPSIHAPIIPIFGITLLLYMGFAWFRFTRAVRASKGRIHLHRRILVADRVVETIWARTPCLVRVVLQLESAYPLPLVLCRDRIPDDRKAREGTSEYAGAFSEDEPVTFEYTLQSGGTGLLCFEGVDVRMADLGGLFYHRVFLRQPTNVLVLPPLVDDEGRQRANKRFNNLPPPGIHRLRRPGSGSELLDLREYIPGDPPKMIAWKVSARRDRLITKEFENDVPVRCNLFLDTSQAVRIGPSGDTPLCRLVEIASGVAQASAASRDLIGLTQFDEERMDILPPARTKVHMIRMLGKMAESAAKLPEPGGTDTQLLLRHSYPLAREIYPDLFHKSINSRPFGLYWKPLLDTRWGWLIFIPILLNILLILPLMLAFNWWLVGERPPEFIRSLLPLNLAWLDMVMYGIKQIRPTGPGLWKLAVTLLMFLVFWGLPILLSVLFWGFFGIRGIMAPWAPRIRKRKELGALFATLDSDTPSAIERYIRDDEAFCKRAGRFLHDHRIRIPVALYDSKGNYLHGGDDKAMILAQALIRAVARAKDNELFVIFADLTELGAGTKPLMQAIRVARMRHHHVMVILPWPDGVPDPSKSEKVKKGEIDPLNAKNPKQFIKFSLVQTYIRKFEFLRKEMVRVGATVIRVNEGDPVQVVLERLDRLRGMRSRR